MVASDGGFSISSATIRNEIGELLDDGYLLRRHASSGAIPSEHGYRHFVGGLEHATPPEDLVALLQHQLGSISEDLEAWVQIASSVIADLVGALVFITAPRSKMPSVKQVELLRLQDMLVMLVLVLNEARVHRRLIELDCTVSESQIETTRNKVAAEVAGKDVGELMSQRTHDATRDEFEQRIWEATIEALVYSDAVPGARYVSGYHHLLSDRDVNGEPGRGAQTLSALEDDSTFADIISGVSYGSEPIVYIGSENHRPELEECSVIMGGYGGSVNARGVLGIVSPMRTAYDRSIPTVSFAVGVLDSMVNRNFDN